MKRSAPLRQTGVKSESVLDNFTVDQLAGIGAIMMAYNEAETRLHELTGACIGFPGDAYEVVSRINGTEGMVEIVLKAAPTFGIDKNDIVPTLKEHGFSYLKGYRDAVSHARIYDALSGVARADQRRGARLDILLTVQALQWLAQQLVALTKEMRHLVEALQAAKRIKALPEPDDQHKARLEELLQESMAQCQFHRKKRSSLKPPPEFPAEPSILEWGLPDGDWPSSPRQLDA